MQSDSIGDQLFNFYEGMIFPAQEMFSHETKIRYVELQN
jgi:hypothetical protein